MCELPSKSNNPLWRVKIAVTVLGLEPTGKVVVGYK